MKPQVTAPAIFRSMICSSLRPSPRTPGADLETPLGVTGDGARLTPRRLG